MVTCSAGSNGISLIFTIGGSREPQNGNKVFHKNQGDAISNTCSSQGGDHQEREQNVRYTRASIIMVVMYFFCHAPRLLPCTAEIFMERKDMPPWLELMISVNHLL